MSLCCIQRESREHSNAPGVSVGRLLLRQVRHEIFLEQEAAQTEGHEHGADPGTQTWVPDCHGDASGTVTLRSQKIMLASKSGHAPLAHQSRGPRRLLYEKAEFCTERSSSGKGKVLSTRTCFGKYVGSLPWKVWLSCPSTRRPGTEAAGRGPGTKALPL